MLKKENNYGKIVFVDALLTNVPEVDKKHRFLVELINKLIEADNTTVNSEIISETLAKMTSYLKTHFKTEEDLMIKANYPHYAAHKEKHIEFMAKTTGFCVEAMKNNENLPSDILTFLKSRIGEHIMKTDMMYKPYLGK